MDRTLIALSLSVLAAVLASTGIASAPVGPLTEWRPSGATITDPHPDLHWQCEGQSAYQVLVACAGETVWDSGRVITPVTVAEYAGPELLEDMRYSWRVRAWTAAGVGEWSVPQEFAYRRRPRPMVRPHIRTFMNFGGSPDFAAENLDLSFRSEPNQVRPEILSLRYSLMATMVIPSEKADSLAAFCVARGLTESGVLEDMFCHFRTDTSVKLHVGAERAENPWSTRIVPGWDPANDRDGDGEVDDGEAVRLANPNATARRMDQSRIPIYYWGPPRDDYVMNVGHPDYQAFIAEDYATRQLEGFDGLYIDTMPPDVAGPGRGADVLEFPRPPEAPDQWLQAMQTMLARVKRRHPEAPVTANGWRGRPFVIDGTQSEGWCRLVTTTDEYQRTLERTAALDARGKMQMIQFNPTFDPALSEFGEKVPVTRARDQIFGLATYYLIHGDHTYYAYGRHPYAGVQKLWPGAAEVDIGTPVAPHRLFAESPTIEDSAGENLLSNGDFELDADADLNPDKWQVAEPVELDSEEKHSGEFSARIVSNSLQINNFSKGYVTLKPNTAYTLTCWMKTLAVEGAPGAQVYPYEFDGATGGGMITVTGTSDWRRYEVAFTTAEDPTGRINFRIYGATGTAWFDDIRLTEGAVSRWAVFAREFTNALVLARPYSGGRWDASTAEEFALPEPLRPLSASGDLAGPTTRISLRSGEAAILIRP